MKTVYLTLSLLLVPSLTMADLGSSSERLRLFASCAGQLSARMEYEWMFDGPASEITEKRRAEMVSLVQATMSPSQGREVLAWRVSAKLAYAALLTRTTFNDDPEDAAWAMEMAENQHANCASLLLS